MKKLCTACLVAVLVVISIAAAASAAPQRLLMGTSSAGASY